MLTAAEKENEAKEAAPKFINRTANTISFNISRSPPQGNNCPMTTPTCSPVSSPVNSPVTAGTKAPYSSPNKSPTVTEVQTKKVRYCQWIFLEKYKYMHYRELNLSCVWNSLPCARFSLLFYHLQPGLVGLVDYDNDSDEEEQEEDSPSAKRARTSCDS